MNNRQIQYATELSKTLNFSQTARQLGISQPALSKHISNLEDELGVRLFNRDTVPMSLTAAGHYFFREANDILSREENLLRSMENFKTGDFGRLRIGVSPFRSLYILPPVIKAVKEKYPGVQVVLHEITSDVIRREAVQGKYDFAIVNLPVDETQLDVIPIEADRLVVAVPIEMAEKIKYESTNEFPEIDFADCRDLPFVAVGESQEMRKLFDKMCASCDFRPNVSVEVVGLSTAWAMTSAGIGATLLPLQFVKSLVSTESVKLFSLKHTVYTRQPVIIVSKGQTLSEYARYAVEMLTAK